MAFVNQLKLTEEYNKQIFVDILIGVQIFLYIAFLRAFVFSSIVFILDFLKLETTIGLLFALLPIFLFPLLRYLPEGSWRLYTPPILWIISLIVDDSRVDFFIYLIGLMVIYSNINEYVIRSYSENAIFWFIFIDLSIKAVNNGNDPLVTRNVFNFLIYIPLIVLFIGFLNSNLDDLEFKSGNTNTKSRTPSVYVFFYICAFILNLLLYYLFFANFGFIIVTLKVLGPIGTMLYYYISIGILIGFIQLQKTELLTNRLVEIIASILLILSIFLFPWSIVFSIFWILGFLANIYFIQYSLIAIFKAKSNRILPFLVIALLMSMIFAFLAISADGSSIPYVAAILGTLPMSIVNLISKEENN